MNDWGEGLLAWQHLTHVIDMLLFWSVPPVCMLLGYWIGRPK